MNEKTLRITYGAMLIAIFGVIMMINRQMGGMLDVVILFVLPIPIVAYAVRYGGKASVAVFVCMAFIAFLLGGLTSMFYGVSAAFIGLIYGTCLYHKTDMTKTLLLVLVMTMAVELIDVVLIAAVSGIGLEVEIEQMQIMFTQMTEQAGVQFPEALVEEGSLRRLFLVAVAFSGAMEGFCIYGITIIVLRRLRIPVQRLTPFSQMYPPKWTGFAALAAWFWYATVLSQQNAVARGLVDGTADTFLNRCTNNAYALAATQVIGMIGYFYLLVFGIIAISAIIGRYLTRNKVIVVLLVFMAMFMAPMLLMIIAAWYISGSLHDRLIGRI